MINLIATKKLTGLLAIVLATVVGATIPASQAIAQTPKVVANIPFEFQNGSDHLPAGSYTIGMDSEHMLRLQGATTTSMALSRLENNVTPAATGKVVFHKYGNRYFLREVWLGNRTEHQVLPKSSAEKKQQLIGQNPVERNGVEVALLERIK